MVKIMHIHFELTGKIKTWDSSFNLKIHIVTACVETAVRHISKNQWLKIDLFLRSITVLFRNNEACRMTDILVRLSYLRRQLIPL